MTIPQVYSFPRYLAAKKSVDDRALNRHVWQTLCDAPAHLNLPRPLRVLEIGAGTGAMVERILEWGLVDDADYTALDGEPKNIAAAYERLPLWAQARGYRLSGDMQANPEQGWLIEGHGRRLRLHWRVSDLFEYIAGRGGWQPAGAVANAASPGDTAARHPAAGNAAPTPDGAAGFDLLIAHAFLDLLDLPRALPQILRLLRPGGWFYFTINFDGSTIFQPTIDPALDRRIEQLYHQSMDTRQIDGRLSGDSQSGRHLFGLLQASGACLAAAGASDWVIFPTQGQYPHDEAYFLHHILTFIEDALREQGELDPATLESWLAQRHAQVERGELVYIAHQLDFSGRMA